MDLMTVTVYTISDDLLIPIGHKEHPCLLLTFHHLQRCSKIANCSIKREKSIRI